MFSQFYPDDEFFDMEEDLAGLVPMSHRDFSGEDDRSRLDTEKHLQTFLPGLKDPRFSDEQKKKTALTILPTTGASDKSHLKLVTPIHEDKPTKNSKILNNIRKLNAAKIEEKPDELRDLRDATVE